MPKLSSLRAAAIKIGLAGDLHFGSSYTQYEDIKDYYKICKESGCSRVFQVGDILEGHYRHHRPVDLIAHGLDEQIECLEKGLPRTTPTTFICGNHEETFDALGGQPGRIIQERVGPEWVGNRQAFVTHKDVKICLFHPSFGMANSNRIGISPTRMAPTSQLEKFLVSLEDDKPDIVAIGHWHQSSYFQYLGMHVFLCGTFQGPGGNFGNSLSSRPAVGSWIVEISRDKKSVVPRWVNYARKQKRWADT